MERLKCNGMEMTESIRREFREILLGCIKVRPISWPTPHLKKFFLRVQLK